MIISILSKIQLHLVIPHPNSARILRMSLPSLKQLKKKSGVEYWWLAFRAFRRISPTGFIEQNLMIPSRRTPVGQSWETIFQDLLVRKDPTVNEHCQISSAVSHMRWMNCNSRGNISWRGFIGCISLVPAVVTTHSTARFKAALCNRENEFHFVI